MSECLLDAALALGALGWAILPLFEPLEPAVCSCPRREACHDVGKHPRTQRGLHDATSDADVIASWWRRWPNANVAVRTGAPSGGLFAIDVDGPEGEATLGVLEAEYGPVPRTAQSRSGRPEGGRHVYLRSNPELPSTSRRLGPGIDTRGRNGYLIVPPSTHASGRRYEWIHSAHHCDIAVVPAWLEAALAPSDGEHTHVVPSGGADAARREGTACLPVTSFRGPVAGADHSRSGLDFRLALRLARVGLDDGEISAHLAADSSKFAEKLERSGAIVAREYLAITVAAARRLCDNTAEVATIEHAALEGRGAGEGRPWLWRVVLHLVSASTSERFRARLVVPAGGYDRPAVRETWDAVVCGDVEPGALLANPHGWQLARRLVGRELVVARRDGRVVWMRARSAVDLRAGGGGR